MGPWQIILIIVGALLGSGLLFSIWLTFAIAWNVYHRTLTRGKHTPWGRNEPSDPNNEELWAMWNAGLMWAEKEQNYKKEVEIANDNLKLKGEFFDFGFDKTVIIIPGRRECLIYSYYYAMPYKTANCNVLVIDQRAHGDSEGTYAGCGMLESLDVIKWMQLLHDEYHQKSIYVHAICVGTCCASIIEGKREHPDYLKGFILDSTFITYKDIYKKHYIECGHKLFPVYYQVWFWFRWYTKVKINECQPIKYMPKFKTPVIFIWGKKDIYCVEKQSKQIFESCSSLDKSVVWFEDATHSHIRLNDSEKYDKSVIDFINSH